MQVSKPTTRQGQVEHILKQLTHEQLRKFVQEKALQDTDFRDTLLICFSELLGNDEPAEPKYRQMLENIIQRYADSGGFITADSTGGLTDAIHKLLSAARKATTPLRETTDLCLATISILPQLAGKTDDPEERLYELLRSSCTTLWECYTLLPPDRQQGLFERIVQEYGNPAYIDADMDAPLLALLKDWARKNTQRQASCLHQLEKQLKQVESDSWKKNYLLEQTTSLISFWKGKK